jgi:hypothetical protein
MPKSTTFAPDPVSMMLAGFTSRWTSPRACTAASAAATCAQISVAKRHGNGSPRSRWSSGTPSTSSITTKGTVPWSDADSP